MAKFNSAAVAAIALTLVVTGSPGRVSAEEDPAHHSAVAVANHHHASGTDTAVAEHPKVAAGAETALAGVEEPPGQAPSIVTTAERLADVEGAMERIAAQHRAVGPGHGGHAMGEPVACMHGAKAMDACAPPGESSTALLTSGMSETEDHVLHHY